MRRNRLPGEDAAASVTVVEWSCDDEPEESPSSKINNSNNNNSQLQKQQHLSTMYEKINVIRRGSQGVVYLARSRNAVDAETVAIKRMFTDMREERLRGLPEGIIREVGILAKLSSGCQNLIQYRGVTTTSTAHELCLVMEACAGDVSSYMQAVGPLPLPFVSHAVRGLLVALDYIHHNQVLHRDVKPSNLLLRHDGAIVLADFGSARWVYTNNNNNNNNNTNQAAANDSSQQQSSTSSSSSPPLTPGARRCTLPYRAPEILLGERHYTSAVDIWGAGVVFAELLRGSHLFVENSEMQTLNRVFRIVGTPTRENWPECSQFEILQAFNFQPQEPTLRAQVTAWRSSIGHDISNANDEASVALLDLIERMMAPNPHRRPSAAECLRHRFFQLVPPDVESWARWKEEGRNAPAKKTVAMSMQLGLGDDDDEDDDDIVGI